MREVKKSCDRKTKNLSQCSFLFWNFSVSIAALVVLFHHIQLPRERSFIYVSHHWKISCYLPVFKNDVEIIFLRFAFIRVPKLRICLSIHGCMREKQNCFQAWFHGCMREMLNICWAWYLVGGKFLLTSSYKFLLTWKLALLIMSHSNVSFMINICVHWICFSLLYLMPRLVLYEEKGEGYG